MNKWEHLSAYFKYPEEIRRIIYTLILLNQCIDSSESLLKLKELFQMKIVYSNLSKWVFRTLQKNGLCLFGIAH